MKTDVIKEVLESVKRRS